LTVEDIKFSSLFTPAQIICHLEETNCHAVFKRLIEQLGEINHTFDTQRAYEQIIKRESCGITFATPEVAVVHVRVEGLAMLRIAIGTSSHGPRCVISLEDGGSCPNLETGAVKLIVMILAPVDDPTGYLRAIAALSKVCQQDGFVDHLASLDDPQQIWKAFEDANEHLPSYVKAGDMMRRDYPLLHDTDTLSNAIDSFCRLDASELPVVDKDGDLVGIATQDELIRICLPEYITWMEDLSPILNFEPFAEILQRESSVPVIEIMLFSDRYATVDEQDPAIQVAKVMMRRNVRQVYVVHDKRLLGVITLQDFIHKVLRA
jgi:mannitol/fructose-specific phosphotransferase system IIA component (Ntr-type)/CBS domain-containing protein